MSEIRHFLVRQSILFVRQFDSYNTGTIRVSKLFL